MPALLPTWQPALAALQLDVLDWARAGLVFLVVLLPISSVFDVLEVKRLLEKPETESD